MYSMFNLISLLKATLGDHYAGLYVLMIDIGSSMGRYAFTVSRFCRRSGTVGPVEDAGYVQRVQKHREYGYKRVYRLENRCH